jgi:glycosyltransferase involved in cell wall biosynthesis
MRVRLASSALPAMQVAGLRFFVTAIGRNPVLKICQVIASYGEGGLEKHVRELTQQLLASGHDVTVLGDGRFLATLPERAVAVPVRFDRNRRNPLLLLELLLRLRACRCDVIHAQANKAASLVAFLRRWLASPTIGTLHNMKRDLRAFRKLDHVVTVSRQLAQPFPADRVSVVYNGIDSPQIERLDLRAVYGLSSDLPVLCAVGRLVAAKGFDLLLDAIDGLPVSLLIAGEGPERASLEQRAANLSPATCVRLLGHQDNIPALMASADAVIISSRREGFSYVCNEALLCDAKILSTDVPVANEVLPSELIVPVGDAAALRERLLALLDDTEKWDELMQAPRQFARAHMTKQAMCANTLAAYRELLGSKRQPAS